MTNETNAPVVGSSKPPVIDSSSTTSQKHKPVAFALPNLSSIGVSPCVPWEFNQVPPEGVRKDKAARHVWINNPSTKWEAYSLVQGLNENGRIRKGNRNS